MLAGSTVQQQLTQQTTTRTLTPAQLSYLKAQALIKQQQQQVTGLTNIPNVIDRVEVH